MRIGVSSKENALMLPILSLLFTLVAKVLLPLESKTKMGAKIFGLVGTVPRDVKAIIDRYVH